MKTYYMAQYTPDYWEIRRGYPTCSAFDKILTPGGKLSTSADDYIAELIQDLLPGYAPNFFSDGKVTRAMQYGTETEPEARRYYSMHRDVDVQQVGFVVSDCGRFGGSPDGLVGDEGALELKCVIPKTQTKYLMKLKPGELPADYKPQVHGHLIITGRPWCDFLSYSVGLPPVLVRVEPDNYTKLLRETLAEFAERYEAVRKGLGILHPHMDGPPSAEE